MIKDFRNFLAQAWSQLGLGEPTRLQYDLAYRMQHGPRRQVNLCFRGFGKSWMATTRGNHILSLDRERKFLNTSAAKKKADESNQFMLKLLRLMPETQHLVPGRNQRSSTTEFDVYGCAPAHAPSVRSLGIQSNSITGSRADDILADDIETKENSQTTGMQTKIREKTRELGGAVLRSATEVERPSICYLGTPQKEQSLYFQLERAGYDISLYPARYPDEETEALYEGRLAPILTEDMAKNPDLRGKPTEPSRFDENVLQECLAEYGPTGWLLQFMLLPTLADEDRFGLKLNDLCVMDLDMEIAPEKVIWTSTPDAKILDLHCAGFDRDWWHRPTILPGAQWVPYSGSTVMAVDVSAGGADELAYVVLKALNSQIFLLDVGGFIKGDQERTLRKLAAVCKKYGVNHVRTEKNFGLGMWNQVFLPILREVHPGCTVHAEHVTGRKEVRIREILAPIISTHRLIVDRSVIQKDFDTTQRYHDPSAYQLFHQMSRLTDDQGCLAHDDRLDALSLGVSYFQATMARDYKTEMQEHRSEQMERDLEEWSQRADFGIGHEHRKPEPTWISR